MAAKILFKGRREGEEEGENKGHEFFYSSKKGGVWARLGKGGGSGIIEAGQFLTPEGLEEGDRACFTGKWKKEPVGPFYRRRENKATTYEESKEVPWEKLQKGIMRKKEGEGGFFWVQEKLEGICSKEKKEKTYCPQKSGK